MEAVCCGSCNLTLVVLHLITYFAQPTFKNAIKSASLIALFHSMTGRVVYLEFQMVMRYFLGIEGKPKARFTLCLCNEVC